MKLRKTTAELDLAKCKETEALEVISRLNPEANKYLKKTIVEMEMQ